MNDGEIKMSDHLWEKSAEQAQEVLEAFLRTEQEAFQSMKIGSLELDFSRESVISAVHHIAFEIEANGLDEDQQNLWFVRLGYYFGEALCRAKNGLSWSLGDPEYAFANHPVITGFVDEEEAPTITICRNMIQAVVEGLSQPARIDRGVTTWFDKVTENEQ